MGWEGPLLGETESIAGTEPFFFDPYSMLAAGGMMGPGIEVVGTSGSGKSYAVSTMIINAAFEGASGTLIDPKSEMLSLLKLNGRIPVSGFDVTDGDGRSGMLDPWLIEKLKGESAKASIPAVMNILNLVLGADHYDRYRAVVFESLSEYVQLEATNPSMIGYSNYLKGTKDTRQNQYDRNRLASELEILSQNPSADLIFGAHDKNAIAMVDQLRENKPGIRIITTLGLNLPEVGDTNPGDEQRIARTILYILCDIIFAGMSRVETKNLPKFLAIDEAWMILTEPEIAKMVSKSIRLGRSRNYITFLVSQNADELEGGGVGNNMGASFVFRAKDEENTSASIKMLGGEKSGVTPDALVSLEDGACFVRDGRGVVGRIRRIIQPDREIANLLDTRAVKGKKVS